jgi:hypothetical protein
MPTERAARDDFLAAAEHIRKLVAITAEIDELIPCGWLSQEEAGQIRAISEFLLRCVIDEAPLVRTLRDSIAALLTIFNEDSVAAVIWENDRIVRAREVLEQTKPASDQQKIEAALGHINVLLDIINGLDEGEESKQLVLRRGEDIVAVMGFVRAHVKPVAAEEQPYTITRFVSADDLIAHLRDSHEEPDESSDYGDEDDDWIVP